MLDKPVQFGASLHTALRGEVSRDRRNTIKIRNIGALIGAASLVVPAIGMAAEIQIVSEGPVVELTISESVTAKPDIATISAGVSTEAPTAVAAMRKNALEMRRVIDQLKALGVDEDDIQTTGINLNARYDYNRTTRKNDFRGYQVSNRVSVKLREIEETGQVLDALVSAGATDLSGPRFSIDDETVAKDAARQRGLKRAQDQAQAYASLLGYSDIRVLEINERTRANSGPVLQSRVQEVAEAAADTAPVQPGLVGTGVTISVKFELLNNQGGCLLYTSPSPRDS